MSEAVAFPQNLTHAIGGVPADRLMAVWDRVRPMIDRVIKRSPGFVIEDVFNGIRSSRMQLWVIDDFVAVVGTSIDVRSSENVLIVEFTAGSRVKEWLDDWICVMEAYARSCSCSAIEFRGRRGWRIFERHHRDYKPVFTIYRKTL